MVALWDTTKIFWPACSRTSSINAGNARAVTANPLSPPSGANVRILFPFGGFFRKLFFNFAPRHLFPASVVNFAKPVSSLNLKFVRSRQNLRRFNRATQRRRIDGHDFFVTQAIGQSPRLS